MKIYIDNLADGKTIFEGTYSYMEGDIVEGKPSFSINCYPGKPIDHEIRFLFENDEEIQNLIDDLKEFKRTKE